MENEQDLREVKVVVEIGCLVDFDDLDEQDRDDDGSCKVDGSYAMTITGVPGQLGAGGLRERIMDCFHETVPIACLEDFAIVVRRMTAHDDPASMKELGSFSYSVERAADVGQDSGLPVPTPFGTSDPNDPFGEH